MGIAIAVAMAPPDAVVEARVPDHFNRRIAFLHGVEDEPDHRPQAGPPTGRPAAVRACKDASPKRDLQEARVR